MFSWELACYLVAGLAANGLGGREGHKVLDKHDRLGLAML